MAKFNRGDDGKYHIKGTKYEKLCGTRAEVWHGTAYKTSGGLTKGDLVQNKAGRIVSKSKYYTAKREKRLLKHGYGTKKGKFGFVKLNGSSRGSSRSRSKSRRGGGGVNYTMSPSDFNGRGVGTSGVNLQFVAGNTG